MIPRHSQAQVDLDTQASQMIRLCKVMYTASDARHDSGRTAPAMLDLGDITSCRKSDPAPRIFKGRSRLSAVLEDRCSHV